MIPGGGGLLVQALGNPVRLGSVGMQFAVSTTHSMPVRLGIYDAAGRRVVELLRDATVTGAQVVRWDGRDQRGVPVVPGTYFYRAIAGQQTTGGRIVVIR
jgi:flagellar hook assembly protein FlgD